MRDDADGCLFWVRRTTLEGVSRTAAALILWTLLIACCVAPIGWLVGSVVARPHTLLAALWTAWTWQLFLKTVLLAAASAAIATLLSIAPALAVACARGAARGLLVTLITVPVLTPSIVLGYGWSEVFTHLHLIPYPQSPADHARCVWVLATWLWPIPCGVLALSLSTLERDLIDQARLDDALVRTLARRCAPSLVAAVLLATLLAMQEFSVFEPSGISVLSTEIRMVFETGRTSASDNPITQLQGGVASQLNFATQAERSAMALGAGLPAIALVAILLLIATKLIARDANHLIDTDAAASPRVPVRGASIAAAVVLVLALGVPIVGLFLSLHKPFNPLAIAHAMGPQLVCSLAIALGAGAIALALGLLATVAPPRLALLAAVASFLVGGQFLAIGLLRLYGYDADWMGRFSPLRLVLDSNLAVVFAHVGRFGWIALLAGLSTHVGVYRSLRAQAAVDGAGAVRTAASVIVPRAFPILAAAAVAVATLSLTEVPAAALLTPPSIVPMLMTWVHMQRYGPMIEASLMMVIVIVMLSIAIQLLLAAGGRQRAAMRGIFRAVLFGVCCLLPAVGGCDQATSQPQAVWLSTGDGPGQCVYPRAIAYSRGDDTFFMVDRVGRVQHLDRDGKHLGGWRMPEWAQGKPVGLTVGPDGNLWVPDTHYHRVIVYTPQGREITRFGKAGTAPGEFDLATDIAFDAAGNIYVGEYGQSNRVQVFDKDFNFLRAIGQTGQGDGELDRPQSIAIVGDELYVADACNNRISVWTLDGKHLRNMGRTGGGAGEYRFPYGLELDRNNNLLITEFGNMRVQLIDRVTGQGLGTWGSAGRLAGELLSPWAAVEDQSGRVVIVDAGNNRLQVIQHAQLRPAP